MSIMILRGGFRILPPNPPTPPSTMVLRGGFRVNGPFAPVTVSMHGDFELLDAEATVFAWDEQDARFPSAQRVWTPQGWFPKVLL